MIVLAPGEEDDQVVKGSITVSPHTFSSSATDQVLKMAECSLFSNILYSLLTLLLPLLKKRAASLLLLWFFSCNSLPDIVTYQPKMEEMVDKAMEGKMKLDLKYLKVELLCRLQPLCDLFQITLFFSKWKSAHNLANFEGDRQNWKPGQDWLCCPPPREGCCAQLLPSTKNSMEWLLSICWYHWIFALNMFEHF